MTERRLRLVNDSDRWELTQALVRHDEFGQLELDFGDDPVRKILVAAMDRIHGLRLHGLVAEVHPVVVLDLRSTIRFDLPGTSRDRFLDNISRIHSSYMRAPMTWHDDVRTAVDVEVELPLRLYHEVIERHVGNLMLLVNKPEHALRLSSMLNVTLTQHRLGRWDVKQAI